jgi:hypothetical protein
VSNPQVSEGNAIISLFLDESGNTGLDLLNADQPVFALASTCVDRTTATNLLSRVSRGGTREVKYAKLRGTRSGQDALVELLSSPELTQETAKFTLADKKFYLVAHLVDKLIEPMLHRAGIDLYKRDAHVGLANVWYYAGHTIFPGKWWEQVLRTFLAALRRLDAQSFRDFDDVLVAAARHVPFDSRDYAAGLLAVRGRLPELLGVYVGLVVFDPAADLFVDLIQKWMNEHPGHFKVTHDRSKPLKRSESFLRMLMKPIPTRTIGYAGRKGELPLRVRELTFEESHAHPEIQLADLIAGASIDSLLAWSGRRSASGYHDALKSSRLEAMFTGGMLPSPEVGAGPEPGPGETSIVDGQTEFLSEIGFFKKGRQ